MNFKQKYYKSIRKGLAFQYLSTPSAPTFGTTTTINPTDTDIQTSDLLGNTDVILGQGTHAPRVLFTNLVGTSGTPIRFKGVMSGETFLTQIGDNTVTNDSSAKMFGGEYHEYYDLYCFGGTGFHQTSQGRFAVFQNIKVRQSAFAGFLIKSDNSSSLAAYDITVKHCSVRDGLGEGNYIGQVIDTGSGFHNFVNVLYEHNDFSLNGREATQFSHVQNLIVQHETGLDCGQTDEGSQNRPIQVQDTNGIIKHSIYGSIGATGSVYACLNKTDGVTYYNVYLEALHEFYIGNQAADSWYANSTIKGNKDIVLDNMILNIKTGYLNSGKYYGIRHLGDVQNVRVRNCILPDNLTDVIRDDSGATYQSIDEGNNIFLPASHEVFNPTYNSKGQITSSFHYKRGLGKDLPDPTIPSYSSVSLSGTEAEGSVLTATASGFDSGSDNNGVVITELSTKYQWQRDADGTGTTYSDITGETSSTYTLGVSDVGKLIRCRILAVNEVYLAGNYQYTAATGAIAANFNPFTSITWDTALDMDASNIATDKYVLNQGTGTNAVETTGVALPTYDGTYLGLDFDNTTQQNLSFPIATKNTDWEIWYVGKLNSLVSNQRLAGYGGSHYLRVTAAGRLYFGSTDTGIDLVANTDYVIRFKIQGATSSITINNGTPVNLTLTTNSVAGTGRIGSDNVDNNFSDQKMKAYFDKVTELTAQQVTDMWTYFGY